MMADKSLSATKDPLMLSRFSLKYQFLILSMVTMLIAAGLGGVSIYQSRLFSSAVMSGGRGIDAVGNSTLLDMFHDGIRAVVYRSLVAADDKTADPNAMIAENKDLSEKFLQTYAALKGLGYQGEVAAKIDGLDGSIRKYVASAEKVVGLASKDKAAAMAELSTFNGLFKELEGSIEVATDTLRDAVKADQAQSVAASDMLGRLAIGCTVLGVLLAFGSYLMTRIGLVRPLSAMIEALLAMSKGDLTESVVVSSRRDEIGALGRVIHIFRDGMASTQRLADDRARIQGEADERQASAMRGLADDFERSLGRLVDESAMACAEMQKNARTLVDVIEAASRETQTVASAANEASGNVQAVAATGEELASSINEISRQVAQSSTLSVQAVAEAGSMDSRIKELTTAASQIGEVVNMISDIAGQTNLLALNATIEAARAGEAGKGFAVVASEVKALASQTTKATDEISAKIRTIQEATQGSVQAIHSIGGTITGMSSIAQAIAAAVEEQGAATAEIARSAQRVAHGMDNVSGSIGAVSQSTERTRLNAGDILSAAEHLADRSSVLRREVVAFLDRVRTARAA